MAEKHDILESKYKRVLLNKGYTLLKKSPFVDYRPDINAKKNKKKLFVEVELEKTLHNDHTLKQLSIMYEYVKRSSNNEGVLVVPKSAESQAKFLLLSIFGDHKIQVKGM